MCFTRIINVLKIKKAEFEHNYANKCSRSKMSK